MLDNQGGGGSPNLDNDGQGGGGGSNIFPDVLCEWSPWEILSL